MINISPKLLSVLVLLTLLLGCKDKSMTESEARLVRPLITDLDRLRTALSGGYTPLDATISTDGLLVLTVETRWGCKTPSRQPEFDLLWDGRVRKSQPPIAELRLIHPADNTCTGEQRAGKLYFDLSPLKKFATGNQPVVVRLQEFNAALAYPKAAADK